MKKRKPIQLDLFKVPVQSFEDEVFQKFREYTFKLIAEGLFQLGEDWWRSRFHDMLYPGHNQAKTREEWTYRHTAEINWHLIWNRFEKEVVDPHFAAIAAAPKNDN